MFDILNSSQLDVKVILEPQMAPNRVIKRENLEILYKKNFRKCIHEYSCKISGFYLNLSTKNRADKHRHTTQTDREKPKLFFGLERITRWQCEVFFEVCMMIEYWVMDILHFFLEFLQLFLC